MNSAADGEFDGCLARTGDAAFLHGESGGVPSQAEGTGPGWACFWGVLLPEGTEFCWSDAPFPPPPLCVTLVLAHVLSTSSLTDEKE